MTCAAIRDLVAAYTDGELSLVEMEAVRAHMETCDACRTLATESRAVKSSIVQQRFFVPVPAGLMDRVTKALDKHTRATFRYRKPVFALIAMGAMMALAVVAVREFTPTPAPVVVAHNVPAVPSHPVFYQTMTNTNQAFALVREKVGADVPPVSLGLVGGKMASVKLYDNPRMGTVTYRLKGGLLNYSVSKTPFEVQGAERVSLMGFDMEVAESPTGMSATWRHRDLYCLLTTDYPAKEPRGLIRAFLQSLPRL